MSAAVPSLRPLSRRLPGRDDIADAAQTYAQSIQDRLAQDILNGHQRPGVRLRLQTLCETYDVSMSPLREALAGLAGRGLVVQESQRGFRVAPVSVDDLRDVTETRIEIETLALRLSIEHGSDSWEAAILAAHHRLSRNPRSDDKLIDEVWEDLHRTYHLALIDACGLPRLLGFYNVLNDSFDRYRRLAVLTAGRHPRMKSSEGGIVKAILAREADRAAQLLADHVRDSASQILTLFGPDELNRLSAVNE